MKEIDGLKEDQGERMQKSVRLTKDCLRGFKVKAINHKINSFQTYVSPGGGGGNLHMS